MGPATKAIEFLRGVEVIHQIEVEADVPKLTLKPLRRVERERELVRVEWDVQHSKNFWCIVRYTHDGGKTWRAIAADLTSWSLVVNLDLLPGGERCMFQIVASSGLRTVTAETEPFEVKRKPRAVAILRPKTGDQFRHGESVVLFGGGHSPNFATADFEDVVWTSNLDGHLGIGHQLTTHTLSPDGTGSPSRSPMDLAARRQPA